eukprot:1965067-Rhodomonas_salina.2
MHSRENTKNIAAQGERGCNWRSGQEAVRARNLEGSAHSWPRSMTYVHVTPAARAQASVRLAGRVLRFSRAATSPGRSKKKGRDGRRSESAETNTLRCWQGGTGHAVHSRVPLLRASCDEALALTPRDSHPS